jgi:hypothetical protein
MTLKSRKYFENSFLVNCQKFIVNIDYPTSMSFPRVYEMDLENDEKELSKLQPLALERKEPNRNLVRWIEILAKANLFDLNGNNNRH